MISSKWWRSKNFLFTTCPRRLQQGMNKAHIIVTFIQIIFWCKPVNYLNSLISHLSKLVQENGMADKALKQAIVTESMHTLYIFPFGIIPWILAYLESLSSHRYKNSTRTQHLYHNKGTQLFHPQLAEAHEFPWFVTLQIGCYWHRQMTEETK